MIWIKVGAAGLAGLCLLTGCNDGSIGASGSTIEAKVSGRVTILGKPATDGEVIFDPANINRRDAPQRRAPIGPDGRYDLITLVGENSATVVGPTITKNKLTVVNRSMVEVAAGQNTIDLMVPKDAGSATSPPRNPDGLR